MKYLLIVLISSILLCAQSPCAQKPIEQIQISEIHYNPLAVSDEQGEFIELYNAGEDSVDLVEWSVGDPTGLVEIVGDDPIYISPEEHVVIIRAYSNNGGIKGRIVGDFWPVMFNNGGDTVVLKNKEYEVADKVLYEDLCSEGISIARIGGTWSCSTEPYGDGDLGSPGR